MTTTIAVAGKGGTGKTTLAALLIRYLRDQRAGSVLAIDADPSSNLNQALGLALEHSIGDIREEMLEKVNRNAMEPGMAKADYLEYRIQESLVEGPGTDLLAMGRPEGPGCYCAANNMLRVSVDRLAKSYDFVVIDNEAGLEHLSRRTTRDVDVLLVVSDASMRGMSAAVRVLDLVDELKTKVGRRFLVVNRVNGELPAAIAETVAGLNGKAEFLGAVPADAGISELDGMGRPLVSIGSDSPVYTAVSDIGRRILSR